MQVISSIYACELSFAWLWLPRMVSLIFSLCPLFPHHHSSDLGLAEKWDFIFSRRYHGQASCGAVCTSEKWKCLVFCLLPRSPHPPPFIISNRVQLGQVDWANVGCSCDFAAVPQWMYLFDGRKKVHGINSLRVWSWSWKHGLLCS